MKNPGLKLVCVNGRSLMSDNLNCPEFTLNPKLPLGLELPLCVLKSVICLLSGKNLPPRLPLVVSTFPKLISDWFSVSKLPVINTSNSANVFVVPSDCAFGAVK